ncbi:MAG: hypothetical protein QOI41_7402 [Myxococcales bacterium]|nr:hypothetical protein [Myxococcales bacterium]
MQQELEPGTESQIGSHGRRSLRETERTQLAGELAFLSPEAQVQRTAELLGDGAMVVEVIAPPASMRGRLCEHVDELVERALGIRGAPSPYLAAWSAMPEDAAARLQDQLFRARTLGATGIAIALGSLARIAAPALTPEDSAMLRSLAYATANGPFVVLIDDGDETLDAHREPVSLGAMLGTSRVREMTELVESIESIESIESVESVESVESIESVEVVLEASSVIVEVCAASEPEPVVAEPEVPAEAEMVETHVDAPVAPIEVAPIAVATPEPTKLATKSERDAARRRQTAGVPVAGPSDYWRSWAIALGAARGPQPLASFERLFVESYMPLANAIAAGLDDTRALRAHDEFKSGFDRTYTDAFATFGATGRRPRLVMDAYDVAVKQARLHNARTTHLLIVDAMRHDLGCLVRDELATRAAGTASLTSESLLWSSLPTTTYRQLETLARGMDALRAPALEETTESLRGRSAETVRRLRVGSRELYKLDVVPSMLGALPDPVANPGPATVVAALADIATSVADAILRHVESLPPRTLLLVLGDHGFTIDRRGRITHGGATPEEVLVPCLAYLVGDLH